MGSSSPYTATPPERDEISRNRMTENPDVPVGTKNPKSGSVDTPWAATEVIRSMARSASRKRTLTICSSLKARSNPKTPALVDTARTVTSVITTMTSRAVIPRVRFPMRSPSGRDPTIAYGENELSTRIGFTFDSRYNQWKYIRFLSLRQPKATLSERY